MSPTTAIAITTGGNPTSDRMTATTRLPGRAAAVQEAIDKPLMTMAEIVAMMHVGVSAPATVVSAIGSHGTRSRGTSACRADWSGKSFATATASTPYAVRSRVRSRPLVPFGWSPVVTSGTTTIALPTHARATCDTFAKRG